MSMTSLVLLPAAEGHEAVWDLPIPAWSYGAIALAVFVLLLGIAWTFRNTAHTLMTGPDTVDHSNPHAGAHGGVGGTQGGHGSTH